MSNSSFDACLYQILYDKNLKYNNESGLVNFDISSISSQDYREIIAFEKFARVRQWEKHEFSGLLSPKFSKKTGISISKAYEFINSSNEYDVFLFHPYKRELALRNDFLDLSELEHPNITQNLSKIWKQILGEQLPNVSTKRDGHLFCHCNYFVASKRFWEHYGQFIGDLWSMVKTGTADFVKQHTPYEMSGNRHKTLPQLCFIFERTLTLFLKQYENKYRSINYFDYDKSHKFPEVFPGEEKTILNFTKLLSTFPDNKKDVIRNELILAFYKLRVSMVCD
ncbi:MAG: hypothetical protein ABJO86_17385 [Lentilitoribacter sp.]